MLLDAPRHDALDRLASIVSHVDVDRRCGTSACDIAAAGAAFNPPLG
jgi:hypothetical protein